MIASERLTKYLKMIIIVSNILFIKIKNFMSAYLAYSYSTGLTKEEQTKIDEKTKKSREEFSKGFVKGTSFSLAAYSLYSLTTSAAHAADSNVPQTAPKAPGDTGAVQPPSTPAVQPPSTPAVQPTPTQKPGFKPLTDGTKGAYAGGTSAVCGAALQSGDFYLGLACAFLLVVGGIVINRP